MISPPASRGAWAWIPSLYFAQGIPYVVVMTMSVILYKRLGVSNTDIALYTSWLYLPWVIKPFWSPLVELLGTKRQWIVVLQLVVGAALGAVALTLPGPAFFKLSLGIFWLMAFASATHDIAADGFYMLALNPHDQAWFVGVRSTFYRLAMIAGQGLLIMFAGAMEARTGLPELELRLAARPGAVAVAAPDPAAAATAPAGGPLRLVAAPAELVLDPAAPPAQPAADLVARARAWNQKAGLTAAPPAPADAGGPKASGPSWWDRTVVAPLGNFIRTHFGEEKPAPNRTGPAAPAGVFLVSLSAPPEKNIVVNLSRETGDKGVRLLEGECFTFTRENWRQPAMIVVQLDPKNRGASEALFVARSGDIPWAWALTFYTLGALFVVFCIHHRFVLPRPAADTAGATRPRGNPLAEFFGTFASFFRKPMVLRSLGFLLLYRFAEAQLVKIASLFLLDTREAGGLGLSTGAVGFVYGTVGVVALTLGGLLGGFCAARHGLKYWLPVMVAAINVPNLVYVYLAYAAPDHFLIVNVCVAIEQFGYGFGFAAFMIYMLYIAQGEHQTAHYAICTGFMALGMMIPGMFTGWIQELVGYRHFFVWVIIATIPSFIVTALIRPDPNFAKKQPTG
ncbi:MAG: MFS transporter [Opitutia bacterium Tous-C1TDCM]|nr:MAG: MFS transporter [Opitutae bacterium Tous-C1TDCM]